MIFDIFLWSSLGIFGIGLMYKCYSWFSRKIGKNSQEMTVSHRFVTAIRSIVSVVFSAKIVPLIKVFVLDVVLQIRILKEDFLRWLMHMLIYSGFMMLLLMHALESVISENLFSRYYSTLNPFFFLRDLFGIMIIAGILIAVFRRFIIKAHRFKTNAMDVYALVILAIIIGSGIGLEGMKMTSYSEFLAYAEEYADMDQEEEIQALEAYWVNDYALVSPNITGPVDQETISMGKEIHGYYCADCHASAQWGFSGYAFAKLITPAALFLDRLGMVNILWHIHFLACFIGLAYLPFSKMFHVFASPISLIANAVMDSNSDPANIATRQAMELDACMHCGTCSQRCSVAVAYDIIENPNILPSEKMHILKNYVDGKDMSKESIRAIQEGVLLCTNCDRCTVACPAGINLKDLWVVVRETLLQQGDFVPLVLSPFSFNRGLNRSVQAASDYFDPVKNAKDAIRGKSEFINHPEAVISLTPSNQEFKDEIRQSSQAETYTYCFSCENCTTVCPVVGLYDHPQEVLGLLPHQIMRYLGMGLKDLAISANMLWDCTTCYQCQEHCPQNVKVTDVFYELKNQAVKSA